MRVNRTINRQLPICNLATGETPGSWLKDNSVLLGAWAWQGFQEHGRGLVWIRPTTMTSEAGQWPWSTEEVLVAPTYLTSANAERAIGNLISAQSSLQIKQVIQSYNPREDAIVWLGIKDQPLVVHLQALKVPPEEALWQMVRRREEFELF